ncbi:NINE protein [Rhodococcus ruber]|uniref:TM2 domain-containing protein n=1 Tax=Rhodococcus ruber TaxID=1830 RepID=UPI003D81718B
MTTSDPGSPGPTSDPGSPGPTSDAGSPEPTGPDLRKKDETSTGPDLRKQAAAEETSEAGASAAPRDGEPASTEELPAFGGTADYDPTAQASLSVPPPTTESTAPTWGTAGPGWNTYAGMGNGPGWGTTPSYPPPSSEGQYGTAHESEAQTGGRYGGTGPVYGTPDPQFQGAPQYPPASAPGYGSSGYGPTGYGAYGDPSAPYGRDPATGEPYSDKSKTTAGLLQLLLPFVGICGVGRLYLGSTAVGLIQLLGLWIGGLLAIVLIGFVIMPVIWVWSVIDGIMMLTGSVRDSDGRPLRP